MDTAIVFILGIAIGFVLGNKEIRDKLFGQKKQHSKKK